jgi:2,3-bisphosphoglycerate-independent phosphoglycerate mutase
VALVTADHGNAEQMIDPKTGGPHTAHTTNLVPLILADPRARGGRLREGRALEDVAPTILNLLSVPVPSAMTGTDVREG